MKSLPEHIGTEFKGKVIDEMTIGRYKAIIPAITGSAYVTEMQQLILNRNDASKRGDQIAPTLLALHERRDSEMC